MPPRKNKPPTPITSHTHADTRPNTPTEELRDFIAGDRADIVFGTAPVAWEVVEIKNCEIGELVQAEKGHGIAVQVDAILVAYEIPSEISLFAAKFGIRCRIVHHSSLGMVG